MVKKQALLAPIWTIIGVPYIVCCGESDGDIPEANFCEKTSKNEHINFESEIQQNQNKLEHGRQKKTNKPQKIASAKIKARSNI